MTTTTANYRKNPPPNSSISNLPRDQTPGEERKCRAPPPSGETSAADGKGSAARATVPLRKLEGKVGSARLGSARRPRASQMNPRANARESERKRGSQYLLRLLRIDDVLFVASGVAFAILRSEPQIGRAHV